MINKKRNKYDNGNAIGVVYLLINVGKMTKFLFFFDLFIITIEKIGLALLALLRSSILAINNELEAFFVRLR